MIIQKVKLLVAQLCLTLCKSMDCSPPASTEFSSQEYWSGLPFPTPGMIIWKHYQNNLKNTNKEKKKCFPANDDFLHYLNPRYLGFLVEYNTVKSLRGRISLYLFCVLSLLFKSPKY